MDSSFPSFRSIETQGCGGAGQNRFQGTGIRRKERKGGQAVAGAVSGNPDRASPSRPAPWEGQRPRCPFHAPLCSKNMRGFPPSRCFPGETVVSHFETTLCWLNLNHTHARSRRENLPVPSEESCFRTLRCRVVDDREILVKPPGRAISPSFPVRQNAPPAPRVTEMSHRKREKKGVLRCFPGVFWRDRRVFRVGTSSASF